jgi:hypothetical protein
MAVIPVMVNLQSQDGDKKSRAYRWAMDAVMALRGGEAHVNQSAQTTPAGGS